MKRLFCALILSGLFGIASRADEGTTLTPADRAHFSWIEQNILIPKCAMCHTTTQGDGDGLALGNFDSYEGVFKTLKTGDSQHSALFIAVKSGVMPKRMEGMPSSGPLSSDEVHAIASWIDAGAVQD